MAGSHQDLRQKDGPREMDTIIILEVKPDMARKQMHFRLKSNVLDGTEAGNKVSIDAVPCYLHTLYAKVLLSVGVENCVV